MNPTQHTERSKCYFIYNKRSTTPVYKVSASPRICPADHDSPSSSSNDGQPLPKIYIVSARGERGGFSSVCFLVAKLNEKYHCSAAVIQETSITPSSRLC
jgi:hypothetical protein